MMGTLLKMYRIGITSVHRFGASGIKKTGGGGAFSCFLFFLLFMLLSAAIVFETPAYGLSIDTKRNIPASLLYMDSGADSYAILVEKQTQKLFLYGGVEGKIELIKTFACSTGENFGDKKKQGDKKTPEGIYFFNHIFQNDELSARYGVMAFVLDYPNSFDRLKEKGGQGIWLHGTNKPLTPNDSKGCVALNNQNILELSQYISLYRTPIIILERIEYIPLGEMEERRNQFKAFIDKWLSSWENKELLRYISCYAKDFQSRGMNWQQWKQYKNRLNKKYSEINIAIDGMQGFTHNGYSLATFRQDYHSERLKSRGIKRLYLKEDGGEQKILREFWAPLRGGYLLSTKKSSVTKPIALKRQDGLEAESEMIGLFIEKWKGNWENKEIEKYMSCYSKNFKAGNMNKEGWKRLKNNLNKKNENITVTITDVTIDVKEKGDEAEVSFLQHYQSDRHDDKGSKRLFLRKEYSEWKIVGETWEPL